MKPAEAIKERNAIFCAVAATDAKKSDFSANAIEKVELLRDELSDAIGAGHPHGCCSDLLAFGVPHKSMRAFRSAGLLVDCDQLEGNRSVFDWQPLLKHLASIVGPRNATPIAKTKATPQTKTDTASAEPTAEEVLKQYQAIKKSQGQAAADAFYDKHRALLCPSRHQAKTER